MHRVDVRQRVTDGIADHREHRIVELPKAIVNPQALATSLDETGAPQVRQVTRRFRLRNLQTLVDVTHADLSREEERQNSQPGRIGQGLEERFHFNQSLSGHIFRFDKYIWHIRIGEYKER